MGKISRAHKGQLICMEKICKLKYSMWSDTLFESKSQVSRLAQLKIIELWVCKLFINYIKMIIRTLRRIIFRILQNITKIFNKNLAKNDKNKWDKYYG